MNDIIRVPKKILNGISKTILVLRFEAFIKMKLIILFVLIGVPSNIEQRFFYPLTVYNETSFNCILSFKTPYVYFKFLVNIFRGLRIATLILRFD